MHTKYFARTPSSVAQGCAIEKPAINGIMVARLGIPSNALLPHTFEAHSTHPPYTLVSRSLFCDPHTSPLFKQWCSPSSFSLPSPEQRRRGIFRLSTRSSGPPRPRRSRRWVGVEEKPSGVQHMYDMCKGGTLNNSKGARRFYVWTAAAPLESKSPSWQSGKGIVHFFIQFR